MIETREASRASFDEIASHPFFSELDMGKVLNGGYSGMKVHLMWLESFYQYITRIVPTPSLERVLPYRHTDVDVVWFSRHGRAGGQGDSLSGDLERDGTRDLLLTQDIDGYIIPPEFVWGLGEAGLHGAGEAQRTVASSGPA